MKIGIDIDEVLADFLPAIIKYHNETYNTFLTSSDFKTYNLWESWGGTKEESVKKIYDFFRTDYFSEINPIKGAQNATRVLRENNDLSIVTSRHEEITRETKRWVNQNFPNTFSEINFAGHYYSKNKNSKTKRQICDSQGVEILIEDNFEYALECLTPKRKVLLFNHPWNQEIRLPKGMKRVHSWNEIMDNI